MKKPFEENVNSKYGAPMGRKNDKPEEFVGSVYLQQVPMVDGDYDEGGAYWGGGATPLYCAWDKEGHAHYLRAKSLSDAKNQLPSHWKYVGEGTSKGRGKRRSKAAQEDFSPYIEEMLQHYMIASLWSSTGDDDESLDRDYQPADISTDTKADMREDCRKFFDKARKILDGVSYPADQCGHDFWLTRNRHGVGFEDRDFGTEKSRKALADLARSFGEVNLYVENGTVYQG